MCSACAEKNRRVPMAIKAEKILQSWFTPSWFQVFPQPGEPGAQQRLLPPGDKYGKVKEKTNDFLAKKNEN